MTDTVAVLDTPLETVQRAIDAVQAWAALPCNDRAFRSRRAEPCLRALTRTIHMLEVYERHLLPNQFSANAELRQRHAAALQLIGATVEQTLWAAHRLCTTRAS